MDEGMFIVFEGPDGAGLSTQAQMAQEHLDSYLNSQIEGNGPRTHLTKEPTDGPAGGQIRMVLDERLPMDREALALLFAADRKDHVEEVINPMIEDGLVVISDRYYLSSYAYQSKNIERDLKWLRVINSKVRTPDLTILLEVRPQESTARMEKSRYSTELYEEPEKLRSVMKNYLDAAEVLKEEGEDIRIVNGENTKERVHQKVLSHIYDKLNGKV